MRVYLGSDHAGYELKARLAEWLGSAGHEPVDCGPDKPDDTDDYPPYVMRAASAAVADPGSLGIVIGGSGNGEQIAANKIRGVRAALAELLDVPIGQFFPDNLTSGGLRTAAPWTLTPLRAAA